MKNHAAHHLDFRRRLLLATVGVVAVAGPIAAGVLNAPPGARSPAQAGDTAFQSSSIKPASGDARVFSPFTVGRDGRFAAKNVTLGRLVGSAYRAQDFRQIVGMPGWFNSDRFDVEAQAEGMPTEEQMWSMVRGLLADRFKLKVHVETRELPVYALVVARSDKTLGRGIRPTACAAREQVTLPPGPPDPSRPIPLPCGGIRSFTVKGSLQARFATMSEWTAALTPVLGRPVIDRTGLTERFDLEVEFAPASGPPGPAAPGVGPTTFTAIEEQLGLRLDEQTGPVNVLVIDHVERPTADGPRQ